MPFLYTCEYCGYHLEHFPNGATEYQIKKLNNKYGNGNAEADALSSRIIDFASERLNGTPNGRGGVFKMGVFSVDKYGNCAFGLN